MMTWRRVVSEYLLDQDKEIEMVKGWCSILKDRIDALEKRCAECGKCDGACQK